MARISSVSASIPKWTLRQSRGLEGPCFLASHSPSPSAFTPVLSDQQMQCARTGAIGDVDSQALLATAKGTEVWLRPIQPGKIEQTCHHSGRLPQWQPKERLQRQAVWIASSVNTGWRPRLPVGAACHCVLGSNQIANDPRLASAAL